MLLFDPPEDGPNGGWTSVDATPVELRSIAAAESPCPSTLGPQYVLLLWSHSSGIAKVSHTLHMQSQAGSLKRAILSLLRQLTPERARFSAFARENAARAKQTEKWYGVKQLGCSLGYTRSRRS